MLFLQVKLNCSRQSISLTEQKTSLTSTVQAKLLRMAGQGSGCDRGERAGNRLVVRNLQVLNYILMFIVFYGNL